MVFDFNNNCSLVIFPWWNNASCSQADLRLPHILMYGLSEIFRPYWFIFLFGGGNPNSFQIFLKFSINSSEVYLLSCPPSIPIFWSVLFHDPNYLKKLINWVKSRNAQLIITLPIEFNNYLEDFFKDETLCKIHRPFQKSQCTSVTT